MAYLDILLYHVNTSFSEAQINSKLLYAEKSFTPFDQIDGLRRKCEKIFDKMHKPEYSYYFEEDITLHLLTAGFWEVETRVGVNAISVLSIPELKFQF